MDPATKVSLFHAAAAAGDGRTANDAKNKVREQTVLSIINNDSSVADPAFDPLKAEVRAWILQRLSELALPPDTPIRAVAKGGRRYNWDFDLHLGDKTLKVEWKYGAASVDALPEFFNPAANYDFHQGESFARFFFNGYLQQVCAVYGVPVTMTEAEYVAKVHGTQKAGLFLALYNAEAAGTAEQKAQKKVVVDQCIRAWLEATKDLVNTAAITAAFQASQAGKHFMLCRGGKLYYDAIKPEELVVSGAAEVRLGKYLVLHSTRPGTTHEMLLRWKNHAGILYPAWQISMKRSQV